MTLEEVKRVLTASGYQGEPTIDVLKQWGWTPTDPLEGLTIDTAQTPEQLKDNLALLKEEAKANNVPQKIIDGFLKVAGVGLKLFGI